MARLLRIAVVAAVAASVGGCATYSDRMAEAMRVASDGDYVAAIDSINDALDIDEPDGLPDRWGGDRALVILERSSLQQATEEFAHSSRGMSAAEQELELLDLSVDPVGTLGSYVYSDSASTYRSPPTERLSLNALNLLNYLGRGDLEGAAVEARRFQVMRDYLDSIDVTADAPGRLGTYMAGFVFEYRGEGDRALRYYDETLSGGAPLDSLTVPVHRLARHFPYRGETLGPIVAEAVDTSAWDGGGEILVVVARGRVPYKIPERIPVGAAVGIAGSILADDIDPLKYGASKVLVYPELAASPSRLGPAALAVDGDDYELEPLVHLGAAVESEYDELRPQILAAALSRMAVRAAAAEGVRAAGKQESQALGDALSIVAEVVLVALDRPDTRSWMTLPNQVLVARVPVAPGQHDVRVEFGGVVSRSVTVEVPQGGFATAVITEPR